MTRKSKAALVLFAWGLGVFGVVAMQHAYIKTQGVQVQGDTCPAYSSSDKPNNQGYCFPG